MNRKRLTVIVAVVAGLVALGAALHFGRGLVMQIIRMHTGG